MVQLIVTVPAGTGGGYYIDSVQKPIVPVVTGGTFRFNQNDATNNGHPLILSTTTSTAGIISTGVSYYLDGASNATNYRNTSLFNAASVRYIEITVAQTSDFYYLCNVHGFSMGNNMDVTINTWSALNWNSGLWGQQNNITVPVTSVVDTPIAWNAGNFGSNFWGGQFPYVGLSLGDETSAGQINDGWGRGTWSSGRWGLTGDVLLQGQQLNLSLDSVSITAEVNDGWGAYGWGVTSWDSNTLDIVAFPTGQQLNISLNNVSINFEVLTGSGRLSWRANGWGIDGTLAVTGEQLNLNLSSVTINAEVNTGWGRLAWGYNDWGADGISQTVQVSNTGLGLNINSGITEYWGQDVWGAATTEWGGSSITQVKIDAIAEVNSTINAGWGQVAWGTQEWGQGELTINLNIAEGEVDPSPDATVVGIGMTIDLAVGTVVIGTGEVTLTGEGLEIGLGTASGEAVTLASVTGIGLKIEEDTVFAGGNTNVSVTGNGLTVSLNNINNQIWTKINTGTDATWIEVDTAA